MHNQLLLLEDVRNLGRKGDLVLAKPGFVRNFLLPSKKAVLADNRTLRLRAQLQEERAKQAKLDHKESQTFAHNLKNKILTIKVKSDVQGHLYGSVSTLDIIKLLAEKENIQLERRNVLIAKTIKTAGTYTISLKLKEDISASFQLKVQGDGQVEEVKPLVQVEEEGEKLEEEAPSEEELPNVKEIKEEIAEQIDERTKN